MANKWLQVKTQAGEPFEFGARRLVPFSQAWRLSLPGWNGGLVWNRPVSVLAQDPGGEESILPIRDLTRETIWLIWGGAVFISVALGWLLRLFRQRKDENA